MYIVWDHGKSVCAPVALLFVANIGIYRTWSHNSPTHYFSYVHTLVATGIACIVRSTQQTNVNLSTPGRSHWAIAFFWLTLITNTLATCGL